MKAYKIHSQLSGIVEQSSNIRKPNEALIRVTVAGVCSTDMEIIKGYAGFEGTLGHEFVGVVAESDDASWVGQRVVGTINVSPTCNGACGRRCPEHCPERTVLGIHSRDGVFAEFVSLPLQNLLRVPDSVSDDEAVFVEPLAAAVQITEQVDIVPTMPVAVVGPGRLGLLCAQVLQQHGADVLVLGRREKSLELVAQLGLRGGLVDNSADFSYRLVIEATGNAGGLRHALRLLEPMGTLVLKSTYAAAPAVDLTPIVVNELTVVGSRCGPFQPAIDLLAQKAVQVRPLIDGRYPLHEAEQALTHAAQPNVRKILLDVSA